MNASVPARSNQSVAPRRGRATFPRSTRLLRHSDFERVYKQGRRHFSASMTVFYLARRPDETTVPNARTNNKEDAATGLRVGFTVGRALGGAVDRNRMKRRLREAVRLSRPPQAPNADIVINPKKSVLKLDFETLLNEVQRALVVVEQKLANRPENATCNPKIAKNETSEDRK